ncbi:hypothetical protein BHE90_014147 [Fusarium euwallaceae]|uniref:Uncharacterized protein n=3 Tax=Fusarium solani species complex TaxID=232080 RepID=A0A428UN09_9HYPO|nr:hypothetical protein CEP51_008375 [Fusarium floridanum]RSM15697.1 hypothetical protein CEP52_000621 [Fusarium oligoseptatum]RTE71447.1 hypothetical protein BHE90_014147 [Fusarium euwallaceae]
MFCDHFLLHTHASSHAHFRSHDSILASKTLSFSFPLNYLFCFAGGCGTSETAPVSPLDPVFAPHLQHWDPTMP